MLRQGGRLALRRKDSAGTDSDIAQCRRCGKVSFSSGKTETDADVSETRESDCGRKCGEIQLSEKPGIFDTGVCQGACKEFFFVPALHGRGRTERGVRGTGVGAWHWGQCFVYGMAGGCGRVSAWDGCVLSAFPV